MKVAAIAMRQLLTDHARQRGRVKRGGGIEQVTLHSGDALEQTATIDLVDLDEALTALAEKYPRQAKVVELRFLTGLSFEAIGAMLDRSEVAVRKRYSRALEVLREALGPTWRTHGEGS